MKSAGATLPWIDLGAEIVADQARLDATLRSTRGRIVATMNPEGRGVLRDEARWRYLVEAARLDAKLAEFNRAVPIARLERPRLPPERAAARFDQACPPD